jgi:hypothetical protein
MVMNVLVMRGRKASLGKGLIRPQCRHFELERFQGLSVPEAGSVFEDVSAFVAVRIVEDVVADQGC